jgi:hypothetical protein
MKAVAAARPGQPIFFLADWLCEAPQTEAEAAAFTEARDPGTVSEESSADYLRHAVSPAIQQALGELVKVPAPHDPCQWMAEQLRRFAPLGFIFQV